LEDTNYPFKQIAYKEDLSRPGRRACRGGAFVIYQQVARAAIRDYINPYIRINDIGFRVVEHLLRS